MDEHHSRCTSCGNKQSGYKCIYCEFQMCESCFDDRLLRNPGHTIVAKSILDTAVDPRQIQESFLEHNITTHAMTVLYREQPCCPTCFNYTPDFIHPDWHKSDGEMWGPYYRQQTLSKFQMSATLGCDVCSVLYRAVLTAMTNNLDHNVSVEISVYRGNLTAILPERHWKFPCHIEIHGVPGHEHKWSTMRTAGVMSRTLSDEKCFNTIKTWLSICESSHSHPKCREGGLTMLPRRLLTIRKEATGTTLRLEEFENRYGKYIALSHCWGGLGECQTTRSNISSRMSGIEYDDLPQTFKDAVRFAEEMDISYIWIDSLCIIQGDLDDWDRESSKMCDYYSNAYLVLAAASANSDDEGFLRRPHPLYRGIQLETTEGSGIFDLVVHHSMPHNDGIHPDGDTGTGRPQPCSPVSLGPLGERAWTLQETLLSRRCVGFNEYEVAWECHSASDCECRVAFEEDAELGARFASPFQGSMWVYGRNSSFVANTTTAALLPRPLQNLKDTSTTFLEWRHLIIPNYVTRNLSVPSDRLPALSGIASLIGKSLNDKYLAGIWIKDISFGLSWQVSTRHTFYLPAPSIAVPAPSVPMGPSFSWVSVNSKISYRMPSVKRKGGGTMFGSIAVDVIDHNIELSGQNVYGSVKNGWVKVSALSHKMKLRWNATKRRLHLTNGSIQRIRHIHFIQDTSLCGVSVKDSKNENITLVNRSTQNQDDVDSFDAMVSGILLLNLPKMEGYEHQRVVPHEISLMLLSESALHRGSFQRIGWAVLSFEHSEAQGWISSAKRIEVRII